MVYNIRQNDDNDAVCVCYQKLIVPHLDATTRLLHLHIPYEFNGTYKLPELWHGAFEG